MSVQFQYYDTVAHGYTGILTVTGGVLVADGSGVPLFTTKLSWDNVNYRLGIGTVTPGAPLTLSTNTTGQPTPITNTILHLIGTDTATLVTTNDSFDSNGQFSFRRANGTAGAPHALNANDTIGVFNAYGYGSTGYSSDRRAAFRLRANQNWTDTNQGTFIDLLATPANSSTAAVAAIIQTSGCVFQGTTTNDNTTAGMYGEYVSSNIAVASQVSLVTATAKNVTSISLTAGDWEVTGTVAFNPAAGTLIVDMKGGISRTTDTLPTLSDTAALIDIPLAPSAGVGATIPVGVSRISLSATTTVYLVAQAAFTISTNAVYGFIAARRMR